MSKQASIPWRRARPIERVDSRARRRSTAGLRVLLVSGLALACCSCLTIRHDVATGAGATQAARGFTPESEARMIYTYIGRIYEQVEDYPRAIKHFELKLARYPKNPDRRQAALIDSEKSVIYCQMGAYAYHLGKHETALRYFQKSLRLAQDLEVVHGQVVNSANKLSYSRAFAVKSAYASYLRENLNLTSEEIDLSRFDVKGMGISDPIHRNATTPQERAANMRGEMVIISAEAELPLDFGMDDLQ